MIEFKANNDFEQSMVRTIVFRDHVAVMEHCWINLSSSYIVRAFFMRRSLHPGNAHDLVRFVGEKTSSKFNI